MCVARHIAAAVRPGFLISAVTNRRRCSERQIRFQGRPLRAIQPPTKSTYTTPSDGLWPSPPGEATIITGLLGEVLAEYTDPHPAYAGNRRPLSPVS
ncbi:hypothetical protein MTY66_07040 [Mycolicibacterium sp. TY66]|nr:hypothetical protein MTY66_07040 [Mycolicibacterium sp. TY66]BCJ83260.1 hypothetical protein MTY81_46330 [Mycolicibacterium sp. TY81]